MRKRRWATTLMALGLVGPAVHAQQAARPATDAGAALFPYNLPPPPLPATPPLPLPPVSATPAAGPALPVMSAQPVPTVRPAAQARSTTFADMTPPVIAPAQATGTPSPAASASPMVIPPTPPAPTAAPMPGAPIGSAAGGPGSTLPAPAAGGTTVEQQSTAVPGQTAPKPAGDSPAFNVVWNNGLNFTTPNKDWVVHLGGRLQFEPVFWSQPSALKGSAPGNGGIPAATATSGTGVGALDDGMFFRRVRLRGDGTAYGSVEFAIEVDFEQLNFITWDHVWAGFKDVPFLGTVRVGQMKVPQGLESMSSDYHLTFLERSSVTDCFWQIFAPGIYASNTFFDKEVTAHVMFHRVQPLGFYNEDFGDGNYAGTGRVTWNPVYEDDGAVVVHVGGSYQWRTGDLGRTIQPGATGNTFADAQDVVRFRSRPELRDATGIGSVGNGILGGDPGRFVDTGFLLAKSIQTASPEFLLIYGPWSVQAEAACARVQDARSIYPASAAGRDRGNPTFWGAYVQTSYFLTGEHRGYDRRFGTFDRPKVANKFDPKNCGDGDGCDAGCDAPGGWGAWEVGYRFSYIDLNDNGIYGGLMRQHTLGVNWYFNDNFKLQANFININRSVPRPASSGTVNGFGMLAQWYF